MSGNRRVQAEMNGVVRGETDNIRRLDFFGSTESLVNQVSGVGRDLGRSWVEIERSPEATQTILENADADERLLDQLIGQRRGIRGVLSRFSRTMGGRFLASSAIGMGVRTVAGHVIGETTKAVSGGIVGAVGGAFWGYLRGKDQTESASTWMEDLGILQNRDGMSAAQTIEAMGDEQLYMALGMMRQAIDDGRVRGNPEQKLEMVAKYHLIKNTLSRRVAEPRETERDLNPTLKKIQDKLASATDETKLISDMAGEEYKEFYENIVGIKRSRTAMSAIKGGIIGGTVGAIFGKVIEGAGTWLASDAGQQFLEGHPIAHSIHDWIQNTAHNVQERVNGLVGGGHGDSVQDQIHAKMEALRGGTLAPEIAHHDANLDTYTSFADTGSPIPPDHMYQSGAVSHMAGIDNINPDNVYGLQGNDLNVFNTMLHDHASARDILNFADIHNIDLLHAPGGQNLVELLQQNSDTFLKMPADVQNFILSHPSVAAEFIQSMNTDPAAFMAHVSDKITGAMAMAGIDTPAEQWAVGLAAAGVGFLGANVIQGSARRVESRYIADKNSENLAQRTEFDRTRAQENRANSESRLVGHRIRFNNINNMPNGYRLPTGTGGRRPNEFVIDHIDQSNGDVFFQTSAWDIANARRHPNPHPRMRVNYLLDGHNNINEDIVGVDNPARTEALDNERTTREANIAASRGRLIGATIHFTDLMDTGIPAARGRNFRVQDIQDNGSVIFAGEGVPALDLDTIITPDGQLNMELINIVTPPGAPRAAGEPEPEPEPEAELNLRPFEVMLNQAPAPATINRDMRGNMVARFAPPLAVGPARFRGQVRIEGDAIEGLPVTYAANIILSAVRADGNEPVFEPILRQTIVAGEDYDLQVRHGNGAKPNLVSSLRALDGTPERLVLYSPAIGGYLQYRGFNRGTVNCFSFAVFNPTTGAWSATLSEMDAATINGLPAVYQFGRV